MSPGTFEGNDISFTDGKVVVKDLSLSDDGVELIAMGSLHNPKGGYLAINSTDNSEG